MSHFQVTVGGQDLSDADYLREMARLCDENVGPPVREHSDRLRAIANRIEGLEWDLQHGDE